MITGLIAIAPAAEVVAGSGSVPWSMMHIIGNEDMLERQFDDTLDVMHMRMMADFVGGFGMGF